MPNFNNGSGMVFNNSQILNHNSDTKPVIQFYVALAFYSRVVARCLVAPIHYLNRCWLLSVQFSGNHINELIWTFYAYEFCSFVIDSHIACNDISNNHIVFVYKIDEHYDALVPTEMYDSIENDDANRTFFIPPCLILYLMGFVNICVSMRSMTRLIMIAMTITNVARQCPAW